jgi:hypothetical protein
MSEELEEVKDVKQSLYDEINWDKIAYYKMTKPEFERAKAFNKRVYCTFLGPADQLQFFMYKYLPWAEFADIRRANLDKMSTHEAILKASLIHPKPEAVLIQSLEAGLVLTLVYQILAVSNFLKDPNKALELILET